jgi:UDP-N-acetylglucosamine--N-acetylmuramyl-(pentapeptide) pyrophosphoryl-undecaprenol N-acetylglucosamine transferase
MSKRYLFAGGGTSGHIYPAIAIADRIMLDCPDSEIEFCGTARGLEFDLVPKEGYKIHPIRASGLPSRLSIKLFRAVLDFISGRRSCIKLIRNFKPDTVIGTGGYVCSPLVSAARKMRVPIVLHEQNAFPGRSNRMMAKWAHTVCTGFPGMESYFPKAARVVCTGNPVREAFSAMNRKEAREHLHIADDEFMILAMGGSLGSKTINNAVLRLPEFLKNPHVKIILAAGKQQYSGIPEAERRSGGNLEVNEYIQNTHIYMYAADLIVCRAGAITCAEIAAVGVPSVMIPYPFAAGDHQTYNARIFEEKGAGLLIRDQELSAETLAESIVPIISNNDLKSRMGNKAHELHRAGSDKLISDIVCAICSRKKD